MKTSQNSLANEKKREWIKGLLAMSKDEEAEKAFREFQANLKENLYEYSFSNFMGLCFQTWDKGSYAFQFASYKKWIALGRHVKKDEKGLFVLVPVTCMAKDSKGGSVIDQKTGKPKKVTFFTIKNGVFSIDQTAGKDDGKFTSFRTVVDFEDVMFDALLEKVSVLYPVSFKALITSHGGYTDGKEIVLNSERDKASQFVTLIHELAHCMLEHTSEEISAKLESIDCETEAELTTLIYCTLSGIAAKGSAYYLEGVDFDMIDIARINRAIKAAGKIHAIMHPKKEYVAKSA